MFNSQWGCILQHNKQTGNETVVKEQWKIHKTAYTANLIDVILN